MLKKLLQFVGVEVPEPVEVADMQEALSLMHRMESGEEKYFHFRVPPDEKEIIFLGAILSVKLRKTLLCEYDQKKQILKIHMRQ